MVFPMAEIYERGQVVVPKYIRDLLGLSPGTKVSWRVEDNKRAVLEPASNLLEEFHEIRRMGPKYTDEEIEELMRKAEKKRMEEILNVP